LIGPNPKDEEQAMNTRHSKLSNDRSATDFDRLAKAAIVSMFAAGALLVGACSDGVPQVVSQALAAPVASEAGYFPTQFPSPEGPPAEAIQGF
jgi:hypothetical protein